MYITRKNSFHQFVGCGGKGKQEPSKFFPYIIAFPETSFSMLLERNAFNKTGDKTPSLTLSLSEERKLRAKRALLIVGCGRRLTHPPAPARPRHTQDTREPPRHK